MLLHERFVRFTMQNYTNEKLGCINISLIGLVSIILDSLIIKNWQLILKVKSCNLFSNMHWRLVQMPSSHHLHKKLSVNLFSQYLNAYYYSKSILGWVKIMPVIMTESYSIKQHVPCTGTWEKQRSSTVSVHWRWYKPMIFRKKLRVQLSAQRSIA